MRFELWVNFYWSRVKNTRNCLFVMGCFLLSTIYYPLSAISQTRLDSAAIEVRYPSKEKIEKFKSDRDYQYNTDTTPPENPLAKFWYWLTQKLNNFLRSAAYKSVWQYVIMAGIAALAIWLLWKAEFLGGVFGKKAKKGLLEYEVLTENIHEIDFDQSIEEIIMDKVAAYNYPVCFNFPAGHIKNNKALKLGVVYDFTVSKQSVSLFETITKNIVLPQIDTLARKDSIISIDTLFSK